MSSTPLSPKGRMESTNNICSNDFFEADQVHVLLSEDEAEVIAPKSLLMKHSRYFRLCFRNPSATEPSFAPTGIGARLPDFEVAQFQHFVKFLECLEAGYAGELWEMLPVDLRCRFDWDKFLGALNLAYYLQSAVYSDALETRIWVSTFAPMFDRLMRPESICVGPKIEEEHLEAAMSHLPSGCRASVLVARFFIYRHWPLDWTWPFPESALMKAWKVSRFYTGLAPSTAEALNATWGSINSRERLVIELTKDWRQPLLEHHWQKRVSDSFESRHQCPAEFALSAWCRCTEQATSEDWQCPPLWSEGDIANRTRTMRALEAEMARAIPRWNSLDRRRRATGRVAPWEFIGATRLYSRRQFLKQVVYGAGQFEKFSGVLSSTH